LNKLLKSILQTGLCFLEQQDRAAEAVRERVKEDIDEVERKFEGEDHTLRYVLTFAAGRRIEMIRHRLTSFVPVALALTIIGVSLVSTAQERPSPAALIAAQRDAMVPLAYLDGAWRGPAWTILPSGEKRSFTQTERIGPFLDGSVKVIEGRGYDPDGKVTFNAFGTIYFNPATEAYTFHSHAMGNVGDVALTLTPNGYTWEIPAGLLTIRYTAVIKDGTWSAVGDRITPGKDAARFFEMSLKRVSDTDWPAGGAISPK